MIWFYDLETYRNLFMAVFINIEWNKVDDYIKADINKDSSAKEKLIQEGIDCGMIKIFINTYSPLIDFLRNQVTMLISYNGHKFDDIILDYIYKTGKGFDEYEKSEESIWQIANYIIDSQKQGIKHYAIRQELGIANKGSFIQVNKIITLDLMALHYLDQSKISLKQVAINIKWHRIQDLPIEPDKFIEVDEIPHIQDYCINDTLILVKLYDKSRAELNIRVNTAEKYGIRCLSEPRSKTGDMLMSKFYSEWTGMKYYEFKNLRTERRKIKINELISRKIRFRSIILNNFLDNLRNVVINVGNDEFKQSLIYEGNEYTFAKGGLHTVDPPNVYTENPKYEIIDADVSSYYPAIIINERIAPEHLNSSAFVGIVKEMRDNRISYKRQGKKEDAESLKISINNIYGKLGFMYSWMYDLKAMYKTTINGQLYLLMLVEMLSEADFQVISVNTDGVVTLVDKSRKSKYFDICNKWSELTNFDLDYTNYIKYVRTSVNDYMAIKPDGEVKRKGDFLVESELSKGYYAPVIAKAVEEYFKSNKDVDTFLQEHLGTEGGIYDFCISQKVGDQYKNEYHYIKGNTLVKEPIQKTIRYYVSNGGGVIVKCRKKEGSSERLVAGYNVKLLNDYYVTDNPKDYDVNMKFYKRKAYEIINKCLRNNTKDISKYGGTLFD